MPEEIVKNEVTAWWQGRWGKLLVAILAAAYFTYYAFTSHDWHFIDNINLIIHEAGHVVFLPFGDFLHILGGSLFQTIFPLVYVGYFYFKKEYFSASLLLFWVGQNLINVSVYAADAQVMQLPLLGGDGVIHDWNAILGMLHVLPYTPQIGAGIYLAGVLVIATAAMLSITTSQRAAPKDIRPTSLA
jgi:hypothetical protein